MLLAPFQTTEGKTKKVLTDGGRFDEDGRRRGGYPVPHDTRSGARDGAVGAVDGDGAGAARLGPSGTGDGAATNTSALPAVFRTAALTGMYTRGERKGRGREREGERKRERERHNSRTEETEIWVRWRRSMKEIERRNHWESGRGCVGVAFRPQDVGVVRNGDKKRGEILGQVTRRNANE